MKMQAINLGNVYITSGAADLIGDNAEFLVDILDRHANGDWGDLDDHDTAINEAAVLTRNRVLSSYKYGRSKLYVITELGHTSTTVLLPEEY